MDKDEQELEEEYIAKDEYIAEEDSVAEEEYIEEQDGEKDQEQRFKTMEIDKHFLGYKIYTCIQFVPYLRYMPLLLPDQNLDEEADLIITGKLKSDFCWSPVVSAPFYARVLHAGFISLCSAIQRRGRRNIVETNNSQERKNNANKSCGSTAQVVSSETTSRSTSVSSSPPTLYYLLPKLHQRRAALHPAQLHISRQARKKAKTFWISMDTNFQGVLEGCLRQHGVNWLHPPVQKAFKHLSGAELSGVKLHSIEVWTADGRLVAGELGSTVGAVYTSLTGFHEVDSAGTVQLSTLGRLLQQRGYTLWDLGMEMDYKRSIGAVIFSRPQFVRMFRTSRAESPASALGPSDRASCRTVIDSV